MLEDSIRCTVEHPAAEFLQLRLQGPVLGVKELLLVPAQSLPRTGVGERLEAEPPDLQLLLHSQPLLRTEDDRLI